MGMAYGERVLEFGGPKALCCCIRVGGMRFCPNDVWWGPADDDRRWEGIGEGEGEAEPGAGRTSFMLTVETELFIGAVSQVGGRRDVSERLLLRARGT